MTKIKINLPKDYHTATKRSIKTILDHLNQSGAVRDIDELAIRMLASNLNIFFKADEELTKSNLTHKKNGGGIEANSLLKIKNDAHIQAFKVMQDFGLTLRSRGKIKAVSVEVEEETGIALLAKQRIKERSK